MQRCHAAFARQAGFQGRVLGHNIDDAEEHVEAVPWESAAHAKEAFAALSQDPDVGRWLEHVDVKGVRMFGCTSIPRRALVPVQAFFDGLKALHAQNLKAAASDGNLGREVGVPGARSQTMTRG